MGYVRTGSRRLGTLPTNRCDAAMYRGSEVPASVDEAGWAYVSDGAPPIDDIRVGHTACGHS
ncbi:hypothetical protein GCM10022382_24630 [Microbacterium invictum]